MKKTILIAAASLLLALLGFTQTASAAVTLGDGGLLFGECQRTRCSASLPSVRRPQGHPAGCPETSIARRLVPSCYKKTGQMAR